LILAFSPFGALRSSSMEKLLLYQYYLKGSDLIINPQSTNRFLLTMEEENTTNQWHSGEGDNIGHNKIVNIYTAKEKERNKELTFIQKVNPRNIVGREDDLEDLHRELNQHKQVVVINGMGGIGKTTLAAAYVFKYYETYEHIAWVTQNENDIRLDIVQNEQLIKSLEIDSQGKDVGQLFDETMFSLNNLRLSPKLFIIDNALSSIKNYLDRLPQQPGWHLLVTSREKIAGLMEMRLEFLVENKAVELFMHYYAKEVDLAEVKNLVSQVDYHTLTIEVLARTANKQRTPLVELQNALQNDLDIHIKASDLVDRTQKVTSFLATIFDHSKLTEPELWVMKQFVCLPPEFHEYQLLVDLLIAHEHGENHELSQTLEGLVEKGWLLKDANHDAYKMHRVVAEATIKNVSLEVSDVSRLIMQVAEFLSALDDYEDMTDRFSWVPFGKSILSRFEGVTNREIAILQNQLGLVLRLIGEFQAAKVLFEESVRSTEINFGSENPNVLIRKANLALVYKDMGDYFEAKKILLGVVSLNIKLQGQEALDTIDTQIMLASVMYELGDYMGASKIYENILVVRKERYTSDSLSISHVEHSYALVLIAQGNFQKAEALLWNVIANLEQHLGEKNPNVHESRRSLAYVLNSQGKYTEAIELLMITIKYDEKNFGLLHPRTASGFAHLATIFRAIGDYPKTLELLELVSKSNEEYYEKEHPSTASNYSNMAMLFMDMKNFANAKLYATKALNIWALTLPKNHEKIRALESLIEALDTSN